MTSPEATEGRELPVVFVVTLVGDEARCELVEAQLRSLGIPYRIEIGVDTRPGSLTDMDSLVEAGAVARSAADRLSSGSIGCILSHQGIYRTLVEEDIPLALIIEDDAILASNLPDLLTDPAPFLLDDRVTMLFYGHEGAKFLVSTQDSVPLPGGAAVLLPFDGLFTSTVGYLVTKGAARRLLEVNSPVQFPADGWPQYMHRGALACMQIVHPAPIGHRDGSSTRVPDLQSSTATPGVASAVKRWLSPRTSPPIDWLRQARNRRLLRKHRTPLLVDRPSPYRDLAPLDPPLEQSSQETPAQETGTAPGEALA